MAKLDLPVRAFVDDYCRRAFPLSDFSRGSAATDLVTNAFAALLQPFRHEIDVLRVNRSISNWRYMRREDLDALAANMGRFRKTGSKASGVVRIFFDAVQDYLFNYLEFSTASGVAFTLTAPVSISATELITRSTADGLYYFDVDVQSIGVGSRYAVPAGAISILKNAPSGVVRVENPKDFAVTQPDESNYDVVNGLFRSIGMRNLVSPASIRAPLLDNFPGLVDVFVAGAGHPSMLRDIVQVRTPSGVSDVHLGGATDVWLNSTTLTRRQVVLSYLPSSKLVKIVSADQAQQSALLFSFDRGILTADGLLLDPDAASMAADESATIQFDTDGIPVTAFVTFARDAHRLQVAARDLIAGDSLLVLPAPKGFSPYFVDATGVNLANSGVLAQDVALVKNDHRRISAISGRVFETAPANSTTLSIKYGGSQLSAGERSITFPGSAAFTYIGQTLTIATGPSAGLYNVFAKAGDAVVVGQRLGVVTLSANGLYTPPGASTPDPSQHVYRITSSLIPPDLSTLCSLYLGADAGRDLAKYFRITAVLVDASGTSVVVSDPADLIPGLGSTATVIQGLTGMLSAATPVTFDAPAAPVFAQTSKDDFAVNATTYVNALAADVPAGTSVLSALGLGAAAAVGSLITFFDQAVPTDEIIPNAAADTKITVLVTATDGSHTVTFFPALSFDLPAGSTYVVQRASPSLGTVVASAVDPLNNDVTINTYPLGLGSAAGMFLTDGTGWYAIRRSSFGAVRTLQFKAPATVRTVQMAAAGYTPPTTFSLGKRVKQGSYGGILHAVDAALRVWRIVPDGAGDLFDSLVTPIEVVDGTGTGTPVLPASAPATYGYNEAVPADLGSLVRQGAYTGVLVDYDNAAYTWKVKPVSGSDLFDSLTAATFVDDGSGAPASGHGAGYLLAPATAAAIGSGPLTVSLDRTPTFTTGASLQIYARWTRRGGAFDGDAFAVNPQHFISGYWAGINNETDQLLILAGDNRDAYDIAKAEDLRLRLVLPMTIEAVTLADGPGEQPLSLSAGLAQGETLIAQPNIGFFGGAGRALKLTTGGTSRIYPIAETIDVNTVRLAAPGLAKAIYTSQSVTWEVVEAYNLPYWPVPAAGLEAYRIYRSPDLADTVAVGTTGAVAAASPTTFSDSGTDFRALLNGVDFSTGEFGIAIDSGAYARSAPYPITALLSVNSLTLAGASFSTSESKIAYRVVRSNTLAAEETWLPATVDAANQLTIVGTLPAAAYGDLKRLSVIVAPHPAWNPGSFAKPFNWTAPTFTISGITGQVVTLDVAAGAFGPVRSTDAADANGLILPPGAPVRVLFRQQDRTVVDRQSGRAIDSFNYYGNGFFELPIVKITSVELLDAAAGQPVKTVSYGVINKAPGLRYSVNEEQVLEILDDEAIYKPIRVTYVTDPTIESVNQYLNDPTIRVSGANQMAKRMETISVSVTATVRSSSAASDIAATVAQYINNRRSTAPLSKADLVKVLYDTGVVSFIDLTQFIINATYYPASGDPVAYVNTESVFGSETACYVADAIVITKA